MGGNIDLIEISIYFFSFWLVENLFSLIVDIKIFVSDLDFIVEVKGVFNLGMIK